MESHRNHVATATLRAKEPEALELIELFYERVYAFLRRLTANDGDAADLTQRTFARVWQKLPTFAGRSSIGSWIHSIAYRLYIDWRRTCHPSDFRTDAWWNAHPAKELAPDEIVARKDLQDAVYAS